MRNYCIKLYVCDEVGNDCWCEFDVEAKIERDIAGEVVVDAHLEKIYKVGETCFPQPHNYTVDNRRIPQETIMEYQYWERWIDEAIENQYDEVCNQVLDIAEQFYGLTD